MSALGQKQTCALQKRMSALPPIATAKAAAVAAKLGIKTHAHMLRHAVVQAR